MISPRQQQNLLKKIIRNGARTSLFKHLGMIGLERFKNFDMMHEAWSRSTPVSGEGEWRKSIRAMGSETKGAMTEVAGRKNLLSTSPFLALASNRGESHPLHADYPGHFSRFLRHIQNDTRYRGGMFVLTDSMSSIGGEWLAPPSYVGLKHMSPLQSLMAYMPVRPTGDLARSRHQYLLDVFEQLRERGQQVRTLVGRPFLLSQLTLVMARQTGHYPDLSVLCPNLKTFVALEPELGVYRTEIRNLLGALPEASWRRALVHSNGFLATQEDPNVPQRFVPVNTSQFFEFVPESDLLPDGRLKRNFRRLHLGDVEIGQTYLLLVSSLSGLLAERTDWIVRVSSKAPFAFIWCRRTDVLNAFDERIGEHVTNTLMDQINTAIGAHGLYIREYVVGVDNESTGHHWIIELSRPLSVVADAVLQSIARRIHSELETEHAPYRDAFRSGRMHAPAVTYVPVGTFMGLPDSHIRTHLDTGAGRGLVARLLLQAEGHHRTIPPNMLV